MEAKDWLERLDKLPLECDGLSRVVSLLLSRENIPHRLKIGSLTVDDVGAIPMHMWTELEDGRIIDLRSRMWLGKHPALLHGVGNAPAGHHYVAQHDIDPASIPKILFDILVAESLDQWPVGVGSVIASASTSRFTRIFGSRRAPNGSLAADNFERWFKSSVAVGSDGEPLVLHHGTNAQFKEFKIPDDEIGVHFGSLKQAEQRLRHLSDIGSHSASDQHVRQAYIRLQNPLRLRDPGCWETNELKRQLLDLFPGDRDVIGSVDYDTGLDSTAAVVYYLRQKGYDGIVYKNTGEVPEAIDIQRRIDDALAIFLSKFPTPSGMPSIVARQSDEYKLLIELQEKGDEVREKHAQDSYIVFSPAQIKSLDNNGLFDLYCDDMTDESSKLLMQRKPQHLKHH